jgi:hypothetical protein
LNGPRARKPFTWQGEYERIEDVSLTDCAHVQHDLENRKQPDAINAEIGAHGSKLASIDAALTEAGEHLQRARQGVARAERRSVLQAQCERCKHYPARFSTRQPIICARACWRWQRMLAASAVISGMSARCTGCCRSRCRTLCSAMLGHPDANDRRVFSTFSGVINGWCDGFDAAIARELAALDGAEQTNTPEAV